MDEKNSDPHNLFFPSFDFSLHSLTFFHTEPLPLRSSLTELFFSLLVLLTEENFFTARYFQFCTI